MNAKKNAVLKYSNYTTALTRSLKITERLHCRVNEETRAVYVCNQTGLLLGGLALDRLHLGEAEQVGQLLVVMRGFFRRVLPGFLGGLDRGLAGLAGVLPEIGGKQGVPQ